MDVQAVTALQDDAVEGARRADAPGAVADRAALRLRPLDEAFQVFIESHLKSFVEEEFDKAIKESTDRAMKRKGEVVAGIMINIMKMVEFESYSDRIVIQIRQKEV